jgi:hypothetical protein
MVKAIRGGNPPQSERRQAPFKQDLGKEAQALKGDKLYKGRKPNGK